MSSQFVIGLYYESSMLCYLDYYSMSHARKLYFDSYQLLHMLALIVYLNINKSI